VVPNKRFLQREHRKLERSASFDSRGGAQQEVAALPKSQVGPASGYTAAHGI